MIVIIAKRIIPAGFRGLTIFPFVFLKFKKDEKNQVLINHEKIHLKQQLELLILPFFIWYAIEYVVNWMIYRDKDKAYRTISFEKEAYYYENDLSYTGKRPFWAFLAFRKN